MGDKEEESPTVEENPEGADQKDQAGDAVSPVEDVISQAGDATSQTGDVTSQAGDVTSQAGDATSQAEEATSQAGEITSQAGEVTSQTGDVTSQAGDATGQADDVASQVDAATSQTVDGTSHAEAVTSQAVDVTTDAGDITDHAGEEEPRELTQLDGGEPLHPEEGPRPSEDQELPEGEDAQQGEVDEKRDDEDVEGEMAEEEQSQFAGEDLGEEGAYFEESSYISGAEESIEDDSNEALFRLPFNFRQFVKENQEFFKSFEKEKEEICVDEKTALVKIDLNDMLRGYREKPDWARREEVALEGLTRVRKGVSLVRFTRTLVRSDFRTMKGVRIVSGGRLGREPLFMDYIGEGMLTAAVLGSRQEGPSLSAVQITLQALVAPPGLLIIVHNSSENRLVFGAAMERIRLSNEMLDMVVVGEDCWERRRRGSVGRQGLAGLLLVVKVAGALAARGAPLKEVYAAARLMTSQGLATISALTEPRPMLGATPDNPHSGELVSACLKDIVCKALSYPLDPTRYFSLRIDPGCSYIILINTYKKDCIDEYALTHYTLHELQLRDIHVSRIYVGHFMGGQWPGFSISVLEDYRDFRAGLLDETTTALGWPRSGLWGPRSSLDDWPERRIVPKWWEYPETGPRLGSREAAQFRKALVDSCKALIVSEQVLNTLHVYSNYGTKMRTAAEEILKADPRLNYSYPYNVMRALGEIVEMVMPGSLGAMYSCLFSGAAYWFAGSWQLKLGTGAWIEAAEESLKTLRTFTSSKEDGIVSLALTLMPLIKEMKQNTSSTSLQDYPVYRALNKLREGIEKRAQEGNYSKKEAILKNQMDVESYTVSIWLRAILRTVWPEEEAEILDQGLQADSDCKIMVDGKLITYEALDQLDCAGDRFPCGIRPVYAESTTKDFII